MQIKSPSGKKKWEVDISDIEYRLTQLGQSFADISDALGIPREYISAFIKEHFYHLDGCEWRKNKDNKFDWIANINGEIKG